MMCFRALQTCAFPLRLSELWLALKLVAKMPSFLLKPNRMMSTAEPSINASVDWFYIVYERKLLWAMLSRPAAARVLCPAPIVAPVFLGATRCAFNYFMVLRALSLRRRSSSTVFPFLTEMRETHPWYRSMSVTCRLICFWSTTSSLSIVIFKLWRAVSILASSCTISFFYITKTYWWD